MAFALLIAGPSGPEKDAYLDSLAAGLEAKGRTVGFIRQDQGAGGGEAPARPRVEQGPQGVTMRYPTAQPFTLEELMGRFLGDVEIALCDGMDQEKKAKVEWVPAGSQPAMAGAPGVRAVVGQGVSLDKPPVFDPDDVAGLVDFLLAEVLPEPEPTLCRVVLGGKRLPAKDFVQDILAKTILAMVGSLRGGDRPGRLEIYISPEKE